MADESDKNTPLVIIKPKAYLKMMKHVLRFGSMSKKKSQFKECMGMLFGKLGDQKGTVRDVIVTDVAEFTHGGHIEVAFEDKDYIAFADINDRFASDGEGIFNIGWYHSHPGLSVFLSTVDVRNHLGFQTTNASAIAIVWDHLLLEEPNHIGFESFRLKELGKGQYSDYGVVKTIVEPADTIDFYKPAIKDVMDLQQAGNPPMFEISELPNVIGDYEPTPISDENFKPPAFQAMLDNMGAAKVGGESIQSAVMVPLSEYMNDWAADLTQSVKNKGVVLNRNLTTLKAMIESKVKGLQEWFMFQANEVFMDVWERVDTPLEDQIAAVKPNLDAVKSAFPVAEDEKAKLELSIQQLLEEVSNARQKLTATVAALKQKQGGK